MGRIRVRYAAWAFGSGLLAACGTVDAREDFDTAAKYIASATGENTVYQPDEEESVDQHVADLMEDGLRMREAVEITLLNNPGLQALFFEIGMAKADLVQAGLLSNPVLDLAVRFPSGAGLTTVEGALLQNIADLWLIPGRKRAASSALERTLLEVAYRAANLAMTAKSAYVTAVAADRMLEVAQENRTIAEELVRIAAERREAGAGGQVEVNVARSDFLEIEIQLLDARARAFEARRQLTLLLGFESSPDDLLLVDELPDPPGWTLDVEELLAIARMQRLDLRSARQAIQEAWQRLGLEESSVFKNVSVGVDLEGNSSATGLGPGLSIQLPLFDQNQAQVSKAEFEYLETLKLGEALDQAVAQEARSAHRTAMLAWEAARFYREELLPQREQSLELAREAYQLGEQQLALVLEAQRTLITTRRDYVDRLRAAFAATTELERVAGLPIAELPFDR